MSSRRIAFLLATLLLFACSGGDGDGGGGGDDPSDAGWDAGPPPMDSGWDVGPEPSELFGTCYTDEQCPGEGAVCRKPEEGWPGGYCTVPCVDRAPCDDGFRYNHCLPSEESDGGVSYCEMKCLNGADCRDGYTCVGSFDSMGSGMCIGLCDEDADCEPGGECNEWAASCVPEGEAPTEGSEHGGPCTENGDCLSDNCIPPYETGFTGWADGYCIGFCILPMGYNTNTFYSGDTLPQGTCAGDAVCWPNGSYTRGDLGVCLDGCTSDADCRTDAGYYCLQSINLPSGGVSSYTNGVCLPMDCSTEACPDGFTCRMLRTSSGYIHRCERT